MCGIAGWVGQGVEPATVKAMVSSIQHRGPDDERLISRPGATLAAARLAIRDVARGQQPVVRNHLVAVLNGELYDADDLLADDARSRSDTEALACAFEARGRACLGDLRGMFGLAIWDDRRGRLTLARDPMGQKPLYWAEVPGGLIFASELRALRHHPAVDRGIDHDAFRRYLIHDAVPAPRTIWRGARKLEPGQWLEWQEGEVRRGTFHELRFDVSTPIADHQVLDALEERIEAAVRRREAREVPWGCLLSGGIDSSLVTAFAASGSASGGRQDRVQTFSLGWERATFDESSEARTAAEALHTDHHEIILSDAEAVAHVPQILAHFDEPLADESVVPTWFVSRFARSHVKVVLTGDGGDELFRGYPTFIADLAATGLDKAGLEALVGWGARAAAALVGASTGQIRPDFVLRRFAAGLPFRRLERHFVWLASVDPDLQRAVLTDPVLNGTSDPLGDVRRAAARVADSARRETDVLHALYLRLFLAEGLLAKVDRATMAHGLEPRSPLLDLEVVDLALALGLRFERQGWTLKWALRELCRRKGVPESLIDRPKKGFSAPNADWLQGPLRQWMLDLLSPAALRRDGLFQPEGVERLIREHLDGRVNHRKPLWALLAFRVWQETHG